jgi:hypothetical protein
MRATEADRTHPCGQLGSAVTFTMVRNACDGPVGAPRTPPCCPVRRSPHETAPRVFEEPALEAMIGPVPQSD